jgi:hypothetical protein
VWSVDAAKVRSGSLTKEAYDAGAAYPVWSLAGDLKMWGHMVRGRLWEGDPLEELDLDDPALPTVPEGMPTIHA